MAANGGSSHIAGSLGYMEETMEVKYEVPDSMLDNLRWSIPAIKSWISDEFNLPPEVSASMHRLYAELLDAYVLASSYAQDLAEDEGSE